MDEDAFADGVIQLLSDRRQADRLAENGRAAVEALYNWRMVYQAWDQVYH